MNVFVLYRMWESRERGRAVSAHARLLPATDHGQAQDPGGPRAIPRGRPGYAGELSILLPTHCLKGPCRIVSKSQI